jgi:hypothetical protein
LTVIFNENSVNTMNTTKNKSLSFFYFFTFLFLIFNVFSISPHVFESLINFYVFLVIILLLLGVRILGEYKLYRIDLEGFLNASIVNIFLILFLLVNLSFIAINDNHIIEIFNYKSLLLDKYNLRLSGINIQSYNLFESINYFGAALSLIFLIQKKWIKYLITTFLYSLFYIYTLQKGPIATLLLLQILIYWKVNKINYQFILLTIVGIFLVMGYFYYILYSEWNWVSFFQLIEGMLIRIGKAGDIILFTYSHFEANTLLNGSSFPLIFGLLELNIFESDRVRLPSIIMYEMYGSNLGGANSSFITDGFANFGYGFDIIFIIIFFAYVGVLSFLSKIFNKTIRSFYLLTLSINATNLVHAQFWSFLEIGVFYFAIFLIIDSTYKLTFKIKNI